MWGMGDDKVDVDGFSGDLSVLDENLQVALDTLDALSVDTSGMVIMRWVRKNGNLIRRTISSTKGS